MRFFVAGTYGFTLRVSSDPIYFDGGEIEGMAIEATRTILISGRVEPERRMEVLVHELTHCWSFFVPQPTTEEERCRLNSTIMRQLSEDLESQGSEAALLSIAPERIRMDRPADEARVGGPVSEIGVLDRWDCGGCGSRVMCGSIEHDAPVFHEGTREYQMLRWMRCDACGALTVWSEVVTSDAQPLGRLVQIPRPQVMYGEEAAGWLEEKRSPNLLESLQ